MKGVSTTPVQVGATAPEEDEARLMWQVAIAMYALGAITLVALLPTTPDPDPSDHGAIAVIAGAQALSAIALAVCGPRRAAVRVATLFGVVTVSAVIAVGNPLGAAPFFYLWPVLHVAYFLSRRDLIVALAVLYLTYGVALALFVAPGLRMNFYVGGVASLTLVGILVKLLRERLDRLVAELRQTASTDPLTELLNRRAFASALERELERARRSGAALTLAVFDLDRFKQVNDRLGHAGGDRALCLFAELLVCQARMGDVVARIGGEEFAVLLLGSDDDGGRRYAQRVARALAFATAQDEVPLTVSVGVASAAPPLDGGDDLLLDADHALYAAKAAGRRRVAVSGRDISPALPPEGDRLVVDEDVLAVTR